MKKLLVVLTVIGIVIGSLATFSLADCKARWVSHHWENGPYISNRYNGSYYYDIGWCEVHPDKGYKCQVKVYLKRNGKWLAVKYTNVASNTTVTCYSAQLKGNGSTNARATITEYRV